MVKSVAAKDPLTLVFSLSQPYPFFLARLADPKSFFVMPKETGTAFDPSQKVVGSGPWVLQEYQPNTVIKFARHAAWHFGPDLPYYDNVVVNIIPTYATQLSQFQAGNLDVVNVAGADLNSLKKSVAGVQIYAVPTERVEFLAARHALGRRATAPRRIDGHGSVGHARCGLWLTAGGTGWDSGRAYLAQLHSGRLFRILARPTGYGDQA
jgi:ABC-type transport system substrate-binding protein